MTLGIGDLRERGHASSVGEGRRARGRPVSPGLPQGGLDLNIGASRIPVAEGAGRSSQVVGSADIATGEPGTVLEVTSEGSDVRRVRVVKPTDFSFEAGQYVKLGLPGVGNRSYSIASAPHEPELEFCIERIVGGKLSPRLALVRPGQRLLLSGRAKGRLIAVRSADLHVFIATTTGIAPFRSMLLDGLRRQGSNRFLILHGASYADRLPYRQELEELARAQPNVTYQATVSRPEEARNQGWQGAQGRVEQLAQRVLPQALRAARSPRIYACGNSSMIANVRRQWSRRGVPVLSEAFD